MLSEIQKISNCLPPAIAIFGETRLERTARKENFVPQYQVVIPFTGSLFGEFRLWCNLNIDRLKSEERAYAKGLLTESANILAGVSLSELADELELKLMLAPPKLIENQSSDPVEGTDYKLHLLDGYCHCRIEVVTGKLM